MYHIYVHVVTVVNIMWLVMYEIFDNFILRCVIGRFNCLTSCCVLIIQMWFNKN